MYFMATETKIMPNETYDSYPVTDDEAIKKYLLPNTTIEMQNTDILNQTFDLAQESFINHFCQLGFIEET